MASTLGFNVSQFAGGYLSRPFRQFSFDPMIAAAWQQAPQSVSEWLPNGLEFAGELKAFGVNQRHTGITGVAKPGHGARLDRYPEMTDTNCIQCFEKIASDLAYEVGLPIPPVTLSETNTGTTICVSAYVFSQPITLQEALAAKVLSYSQMQRLSQVLSAANIFDVFIGNSDRHQGNIIVGHCEDGQIEFALIDHAYAFGCGEWTEQPINLQPVYCVFASQDAAARIRIAHQIASLSDQKIAHLVNRLVPFGLPTAIAASLVANLQYRANSIVSFIERQTSGGIHV